VKQESDCHPGRVLVGIKSV